MRASILAVLSLSGCYGNLYDSPSDTDTDPSADADTDADADSDADSDADADADSDTDVDVAYASLSGLVTYTKTVDGQPACDFDVAFASTAAYTGPCTGCDFAFQVSGDIVRQDSTDCAMDRTDDLLSFQDGPEASAFWLAFAPQYTTGGSYYSYYDYGWTYDNALILGWNATYTYYDYWTHTPYTYAYATHGFLAYDGLPYGSATFDGTQLDWTFEYEQSVYDQPYGDDCGGADLGRAGLDPITDAQSAAGSLPCDTDVQDVWEVDVADGATLAVSVDTVDTATAFDPSFWINDGHGCIVAHADDGFRCTADPLVYHPYWAPTPCPAWALDVGAGEGGTWQIVVDMTEYDGATCPTGATDGVYELAVDGATPGSLVLAHAGVTNAGSNVPTVVRAVGTATLVPR